MPGSEVNGTINETAKNMFDEWSENFMYAIQKIDMPGFSFRSIGSPVSVDTPLRTMANCWKYYRWTRINRNNNTFYRFNVSDY